MWEECGDVCRLCAICFLSGGIVGANVCGADVRVCLCVRRDGGVDAVPVVGVHVCWIRRLALTADMIVIVVAVPPEQLYASQLSQLQEMGFIDTQENIRALSAVGGNVHAAVERLLGNLG